MDFSGILADDELTELVDADIPRVDLVGKGANGIPRFLIAKQDEASAGLLDPEFVRSLIGKQADPAPADDGKVTMTGTPAAIAAMIHKAARAAASAGVPEEAAVAVETVAKDMADLDASSDGMDPAVPLAEPDGDYAGSPAEPGSPAWEAVDAATACKWTSMLARTRAAVSLLADREMMEAASGDEDDAENAFNLQDACCAIDFAIGVLAPFAVAEQSEADCGDQDVMAMVGKSAGTEPGPMLHDAGAEVEAIRKVMAAADLADPLAKLEGLTGVIKAGRVLSSVNEAHIREAAGRLNTVLQSLPQAPTADDGQPVAKEQETTVPETSPNITVNVGGSVTSEKDLAAQVTKAMGDRTPEDQARDSGPVNAGGVTGMGQPRVTGPDSALPGDGPQAVLPGDAQVPGRMVVKADGEPKAPMMVVYNQVGKLVGIVDPGDITPVANAEADPDDDMDDDPDGDGTDAAAPADAATDMTPQPPAEAGTPAGAMPDDGVAKAGSNQDVTAMLESIVTKAIAAALGEHTPAEDVARQADVAGLLEQVETLKARLATVEEQPAAPKVFSNGAVPPAHQMRGQDQGAAPGQVDVAKALDLKHEMYTAGPAKAKQIQDDMTQMAIDQLASIHRR